MLCFVCIFLACSAPVDTGAAPKPDTGEPQDSTGSGDTVDSTEPEETADTAPEAPSLQSDQATYDVGERVWVTFSGARGTPTDWVGLYPADQVENEGSTAWVYTSGTQAPGAGPVDGTLRFLPINLPAGEWEARLFHEDGYDLDARVAFRVKDPGDAPCPPPTGDLTVMTFNSWLDGSSVADGVEKIAAAVVACDPDLVAFQEGGSAFAEAITAALAAADPVWAGAAMESDGADNVIVSRLPLLDAEPASGGYALRTTAELPDGSTLQVVGTHFDYTWYGPWLARDGATAEEIETTELTVRGDDADRVISSVDGLGAALVLGDHNAPSHLDWTVANMDQNFDLSVAWPSSLAFVAAGFVDGYRAVHPDPVADRGLTWSPGYPKGSLDPEDVHDRIDFIYSRDGDVQLTPVAATIYAADPWPSDHRAVVVSYAVAL